VVTKGGEESRAINAIEGVPDIHGEDAPVCWIQTRCHAVQGMDNGLRTTADSDAKLTSGREIVTD
jgi:hypothetical protein